MSLFYQLQGFTPEESQKGKNGGGALAEQPEQFVQVMGAKRARLIRATGFPNQWTAALSAGISHGNRPRLSRLFHSSFSGGFDAVLASFGISLVAHFAVGRPEIADHDSFLVGVRLGG